MDALERIKEAVETNPIIIFMKGTPQLPQCGFSSRAARALQQCGVEFAHVNILEERDIYENLPKFSNWPTFPQLFVNGQLVGGCDITLELMQKGELKPMLENATSTSNSEVS